MSDRKIVETYFKAWDDHNLPAIMDTFNVGGTYIDPAVGKVLSGDAIGQYTQSLLDAFPDLKLELISNEQASNGMWVAPWILTGTPADGVQVELFGCDFIVVNDGGIDEVCGVFNPAQLT